MAEEIRSSIAALTEWLHGVEEDDGLEGGERKTLVEALQQAIADLQAETESPYADDPRERVGGVLLEDASPELQSKYRLLWKWLWAAGGRANNIADFSPSSTDIQFQRMTRELAVVAESYGSNSETLHAACQVLTRDNTETTVDERWDAVEDALLLVDRLLAKAESEIRAEAAKRSGPESSEGRSSSGDTKAKLTIKAWSDLGIGINEKGEYLGITPCPDSGGVFAKGKSRTLRLNGERFKALFRLLAESPDANQVPRSELYSKLGYVDQVLAEVSLDGDESCGLELGCSNSYVAGRLRRKLNNAIADLNRELRKQVDGPPVQGYRPPLESNGDNVVSTFTVRYLLQDDAGSLRFGPSSD